QALPVIRFRRTLGSQQDIYPPPQEIPRCWVLWTDGLRTLARSVPEQPSRKHFRIVEYQQVAGAQHARKVTKLHVAQGPGPCVQVEKTRSGAVAQRFLRNQGVG